MDEISISEFKATCIAVIDEVRTSGRPVTITRRGTPIGQIVPPPANKRKTLFGCVEGWEVGDVLSPLPSEAWGRLAP